MPDTLVHFGVQILVGKALFRRQADARWIGLSCLLPDLPWILQRAMQPLGMADPISLRLYAVIQSSLLFCLLLAAAISLQTERSRQIFLLLAGNCLLHLLLDPLEIKWGNGTVLAAPFFWRLTSFALFWPEELPPQFFALLGALIFPAAVWSDRRREIRFLKNRQRQSAGLLLLLAYFVLPFRLFNGPLGADIHYAATLQAADRSGKKIEFDRRPFKADGQTLLSYSGETLQLKGSKLPAQDSILSIQGRFADQQTIFVTAWHLHSGRRDLYSQIGIFLLLCAWFIALCAKRISISQL